MHSAVSQKEADVSSPIEEIDSDISIDKDYKTRASLGKRVEYIVRSIIGNGYDIFTKPHTATWLVLFLAISMYLTCFYFNSGRDSPIRL